MKKWILIFVAMIGMAVEASAATPMYDIGYSTFMPTGVDCTSGTAVRVNTTRPTGFGANVAGYRIQNQDSSSSVWIGGISVSTSAATNRGEQLAPGASAPYPIGKDYLGGIAALVPIYCKAADASGTTNPKLSITWYGY